ncbi:MAG: ABC transporter substrate-binding protein [Gracilimonas sp.]|uniref:ABC transporter substrate-binding protein n=1 Tax=Gracilimonas sp. TaxID=1974203 RepID=UPI00198F11BA|nr:ABC transporter substrate-binding protein [Gracilimonas sp.]MBD3615807.1 ABC transporter substrate-binding protein [Gracilimonas sp.]
MKRLLLVFTFLTINTCLFAQSLETGIEFYEEGNYERALLIFENLDSPTAQLFTGKSYFALNNFLKAKYYLNKVDSTAEEMMLEAKYTKALADFQLKNFASSLDALYEIKEGSFHPSITRSAYNFYRELNNYLSLNQRYVAFRASAYDNVRLDLVESAVGKVDLSSARALFSAYKSAVTDADTTKYASLKAFLSDSSAYTQRFNQNSRYPKAPSGLAYNIGVALPEFDIESAEFEISQHLYFGIQLAIENFNSENTDQKAFITYRNTEAEASKAASISNDLIWNHDVDAIIGPLFSEVAEELSKYAELYQRPLLTPLANSDSLNLDLNYTYQLNPTFAVQGRTMARHAIQNLGHDTLAVIAERGSLGEPSAIAFLDEARKLGGEVVRYYVEDFSSQGYDISEYVKYFDPNPDEEDILSYNIDAVYAPFTGNIAETLISSLLTNLEAMQSKVTILGSEEWETVNIGSRRLPETNIYYTKTFDLDINSSEVEDFESAFRLRFDTPPNRFAYIGYDAANLILETLKQVQNPVYLKEGLKKFNNYQGLSTDISFKGTHINQEVKIKRIRAE